MPKTCLQSSFIYNRTDFHLDFIYISLRFNYTFSAKYLHFFFVGYKSYTLSQNNHFRCDVNEMIAKQMAHGKCCSFFLAIINSSVQIKSTQFKEVIGVFVFLSVDCKFLVSRANILE